MGWITQKRLKAVKKAAVSILRLSLNILMILRQALIQMKLWTRNTKSSLNSTDTLIFNT